jgi:CRP/FNR family transcriptional regulator
LHETRQFNDRIHHRRLIKRNEYLHRAGSELLSLFVVNSGFLKTGITNSGGFNQVTGFSMTGELVGLDAIGTGKHQCDTTALEDSHLCGMRYSDLEELGHAIPALQHHFHGVMGVEVARNHGTILLLGAMRVEERVAVFLLDLAMRFSARGYSGTHFRLPMTRQDIASYLGLKMETVSRAFSHLNSIGLVATSGKDVEIRNLLQLQHIVGDHDARWSLIRRRKPGTASESAETFPFENEMRTAPDFPISLSTVDEI